jgi:adenylate cyclase
VLGRVRLASGLVLFTYVATHLVNHALGIVSLEAMDRWLAVAEWVWRNPLGTAALYGAFVVHIGTVLFSLYRRRDLRFGARETVQVLAGLTVPFLLAEHFAGTRAVNAAFDVDDGYAYVLLTLWVAEPIKGLYQAILIVVAWGHGCLGLYAWLRLKPWFRKAQPYLYGLAIVIPVLSLVGFADGGREVERRAADPAWVEAQYRVANLPNEAAFGFYQRTTNSIILASLALLAVVAAAREARALVERRQGLIALSYGGRRDVRVPRGTSVLEASRRNGIAHASVCGGRGRCSTCRVRVGRGARDLPAPSEEETRVLRRIGAPPNVRLACQLRPTAPVEVTPLLPASAGADQGHPGRAYRAGTEREIAILFADLRGFTRIAEQKLPYDVVFVLNRYFASMGAVVERHGGHLDKFIGDGVMALFGLESGPVQGCRQALAAARGMAEELDLLNASLASDLDAPLRLGIGVHAGAAIVGEMGYASAMSVTAVGDAVNTASRLEAMTKDFDAQLVVSEDTAGHAGVDLGAFPSQQVQVRGRVEPMKVRIVLRAADLPAQA